MKIRKAALCLVPPTRNGAFLFYARRAGAAFGESGMSDLFTLRCRECGRDWGHRASSICEDCLAPLEVKYDLDAVKRTLTRENIAARPANLWRYAELLPLPEGYRPNL